MVLSCQLPLEVGHRDGVGAGRLHVNDEVGERVEAQGRPEAAGFDDVARYRREGGDDRVGVARATVVGCRRFALFGGGVDGRLLLLLRGVRQRNEAEEPAEPVVR